MSQTVDTRTPEFRNCLSVWPKEAQMCDCVYCKHVCVCVWMRMGGGAGNGMAALCILCRSLLFFRARKMGLCNGHVI